MQGGGGADRRAFGETANPDEYVPREACEQALRDLEQQVRRGRAVALTTPPGLGRTLLLRLLERRLGSGHACLYLPYAAVTLEELCAWALGLLGEPPSDRGASGESTSQAASDALLARARDCQARGETLTLLIDDAGSMPLETARALRTLVRESGNRLRVIVGAADDAASSRVLAGLHPDFAEVRFTEPMSARETRLYVETRLEQAGVASEVRARFDPEALGALHRLSGGVPRQVHDLASELLDAPPEGVGRAWAEERWLGAPLEGIAVDVEASGLDADDLAQEPPDLPEAVGELEVLTDEDDPELRSER